MDASIYYTEKKPVLDPFLILVQACHNLLKFCKSSKTLQILQPLKNIGFAGCFAGLYRICRIFCGFPVLVCDWFRIPYCDPDLITDQDGQWIGQETH